MITDFFNWLEVLTGGDKMLMGFITAPIVAVIGGLVGMMLTKVPNACKDFFLKQCITSLTVNNSNWHNRQVFNNMTAFIYKHCTSMGSRTLSVDSGWDELSQSKRSAMGIGLGRHFFIYNGRLMWVNRVQMEGTSTELVDQITIGTLGRGHTVFHRLLVDNIPPDENGLVPVYNYGSDGWQVESKIRAGGLDSLALEKDTLDFFRKEIQFFLESKDGFIELGLPYKISFLLHGLPGTGKTSIIRAIAAEFGFGICLMNLNTLSDESLARAFAKLPKNVILAIEDCDTSHATKSRGTSEALKSKTKEKTKEDVKQDKDDLLDGALADAMGVSLSGLLNALDGVCSIDHALVFLTTNYPERLDDAIVRPGRVDYRVELPVLSSQTVRAHFEKIYPNQVFKYAPSLLGCEVNEIKNIAKLDSVKAAELLENHDSKMLASVA